MRTIRLKNFRSFEDTGTIELRPLVVLVGANNSGKSSFLRFFPLLRQTFEAPSPPASPLLWYAKGSYVDFGDFSGAVRRGAVPREIVAEFEHVESVRHSGPPNVERVPLTLSVSFREVDGKTRTAAWSILGDGVSCTLDFMKPDPPGNLIARTGAEIVLDRTLDQVSDYYTNAFVPYYRVLDYKDLPNGVRILHSDRGFEDLTKEIEAISGGLVQEEEAKALAKRVVSFGDAERMMHSLRDQPGGSILENCLRSESKALQRIRALALAARSPDILTSAAIHIAGHSARTVYIKPFRANPERYYRFEEHPLAHVLPGGENLAMLLRALTADELEGFAGFVHEHFEYRVHLRSEGSHVSMLLEDSGGSSFNVMDMGYGFSQVLPIVAQCWMTARGRRSKRDPPPSMLAIEQPELHLHPFYQAKLADMFAGVIKAVRDARKDDPQGIQLIVETHSEALLSRLGELVEEGKLAAEDVSVLLFEKDPKTGITSIRQSDFAPDGTLTNWPIGFFAP